MTLTQYNNQKDPQHLNSGEVILSADEIQIIHTLTPKYGLKKTLVYLIAFNFSYVIVEGSNVLRTMDEDGNPKGWSVFSFELPKE